MIVDLLSAAPRYAGLHPRFPAAFSFLEQPDLGRRPPGKVELDGDQLFAIISHDEGRGREASLLECHRRYIDIQFVISGVNDSIGWRPTEDCQRISQPYDAESDLQFFFDRPETWLDVRPGAFCIFWPEDAHAPLATSGALQKVIVKIAL